MTETNEEKEARVFSKFADAAGFFEKGAEFHGTDPPHPDIMMTGLPEGDIAFELVELISEAFAKSESDMFSTNEELWQYYDNINEVIRAQISEKFADAMIYVQFNCQVSKNKRRKFYSKIFDMLAHSEFNKTGDFPVCKDLENSLDIKVYRGRYVGPIFNTSLTVFPANPIQSVLSKKLEKNYETTAHLDLLAYIESQPMLPKDIWLDKIKNFLDRKFKHAKFEIVWIFDMREKEIMLKWKRPNID